MSARDWDASSYERVSDPQFAWAHEVLDRLPLRGDETVLDAGCGSGRVTRLLLERLPRGRVVAVDASPAMVAAAREALDSRATVIQGDLVDLELDEPVDAAFSNAVFHWVLDHDRLFERLHAALRPGGRLVAQCGGAGNVQRFLGLVDQVAADPAYSDAFAGWERPVKFAGVDETTARLERAGFPEPEVWLEPRPAAPPDVRDYIRTVCLRPNLERLPPELRDRFVDEVATRIGERSELDYVRLNISARRA